MTAATRLRLQKRCCACKAVKPASAFGQYRYTTNQGKSSVRLDSRCRACNRVRDASRHAANRETANAATRAHHRANRQELNRCLRHYRSQNLTKVRLQRVVSEQKRRLRGYNACVKAVREVTERALELARFGDRYLDAYTGALIDNPTIDHIVPLSDGGAHTDDNVCVTSRAMNSSKHNTPLLLWLVRRAAA